MQARALLEKAERLIGKLPSEDRTEVERLMNQVQNALTDRKWDLVHEGCDQLSDVLFYIEDV